MSSDSTKEDVANLKTLPETNKTLRFYKSNADVGVHATHMATSVGGFVVGPALRQALDGKESPFVLLDWYSKHLNRINRSSLNKEAQAAGACVDIIKWALLENPVLDPRNEDIMKLVSHVLGNGSTRSVIGGRRAAYSTCAQPAAG